MARRLAASLLMLVTMSSMLAGTALAADPDDLGLPPRSRSGDAPPDTTSSPKVHRDTQSAPGANGRLSFAFSPFNAPPNAIWSMESNGSDDLELTPGGVGWG